MTLASFWSWAGQFESYLVENPEDRFSRDEAQVTLLLLGSWWLYVRVYCYQVFRDSVRNTCCFLPISSEGIDGFWQSFAETLILTRSRLGLLGVNIHQYVIELWHLMIFSWGQNFVSAQYLEKEWKDLDKILYIHWYWQDLGCNCYTSIFANL